MEVKYSNLSETGHFSDNGMDGCVEMIAEPSLYFHGYHQVVQVVFDSKSQLCCTLVKQCTE